MKYRDHTGSLDESLKTQQEFSTLDQLVAHLNKFFVQFGKEVEKIKFRHVGMDERCGWDTYYVLYQLKGESEYLVAGMSDGQFNTQENDATAD